MQKKPDSALVNVAVTGGGDGRTSTRNPKEVIPLDDMEAMDDDDRKILKDF